MNEPRPNPFPGLTLVGGRIALDFANTKNNRLADEPGERLAGYAGVLAWAELAEILSRAEAERLAALALSEPAEAERVFRRAIELREAIYRIFSSLAAQGTPAGADLDLLNREMAEAMGHLRVAKAPTGFTWDWGGEGLDRVLWPLARDAGELLVSADWERVGECADEVCGWLFLDTSKSGRRRWCDMRDCGNRNKVRRHRERTRPADDS